MDISIKVEEDGEPGNYVLSIILGSSEILLAIGMDRPETVAYAQKHVMGDYIPGQADWKMGETKTFSVKKQGAEAP